MNRFFEWREVPEGDFAVIGNPVSHSLSPRMHQAAYLALNLDLRYHAVRVDPGEVPFALERMRELGYLGVNATVPHKKEILSCVDEVQDFARRVEAGNTVDLQRNSCINTDAPGFLETLVPFGFQDKTALVLGAGGSARALVAVLVESGWTVSVFNRTASKAQELVDRFGGRAALSPDPSDMELILNTTSAAFENEGPAVHWDMASTDALAYDLMYASQGTPFLKSAAEAGLRTIDGLGLLVAQGALAFEYWLGLAAPRQAMREAIEFTA